MAAADPLALRALVVLSLVVGVTIGHGDWTRRLSAALTPQFGAMAAQTPAALDLWINPPDYTALPPLYLERTAAPTADAVASALAPPAAVTVPAGSTLLDYDYLGDLVICSAVVAADITSRVGDFVDIKPAYLKPASAMASKATRQW